MTDVGSNLIVHDSEREGNNGLPRRGGIAEMMSVEDREPQEILRRAIDVYGDRLTLSVSFGGAEGMVLLDMLSRITDRACVFTLDTGFLFEETVRFREEAMRRYPLRIEVVKPTLSVEEQVERYGRSLRSCAPDVCCEIRKVEAQRRFLENYDAWVTSIRRDQTPERAGTRLVVRDGFFEVAKLAPLAGWDAARVREYVSEHDVPLNPLLERGYRSIGCEPQTRPVAPDEDPRAGRWSGMEKTECGLHWVEGQARRAGS